VIACNQDDLEKEFSDTIESAIAHVNLFDFWEYYFKEKFKLSIDSIKELSVSNNKKSSFCAATFYLSMPIPTKKVDSPQFRGILMGIKASDDTGGFTDPWNIDDAPQTIGVEFKYKVSLLEKSLEGKKREISFSDFQKIVMPVYYRMFQMMVDKITKEQPQKTNQIWWDQEKYKKLRESVVGNKEIDQFNRNINLCTIEYLSKSTYLDSYISFVSLTTNPNLSTAFMTGVDPSIQKIIDITNNAKSACNTNNQQNEEKITPQKTNQSIPNDQANNNTTQEVKKVQEHSLLPSIEGKNSPFSPSFDCARIKAGAERLICSDKDLSKLDVELSQAYSKARNKLSDKNQIRSEQNIWLKSVRNACSDKECMIKAYEQRISNLSQ
jgi:uncharacterized protein YecT (DUF1311 family)